MPDAMPMAENGTCHSERVIFGHGEHHDKMTPTGAFSVFIAFFLTTKGAATMAPPSVESSDFDDEEEVTSGGKPSYSLVRLADDDSALSSFDADESNDVRQRCLRFQRFLERTIIPDESFELKGIRLLDGVEAVRFLKFVALTFIGIALIHWFVRLMVRSIVSTVALLVLRVCVQLSSPELTPTCCSSFVSLLSRTPPPPTPIIRTGNTIPTTLFPTWCYMTVPPFFSIS